MEVINVPTILGIRREIVYNVKDFPYELLFGMKTCKGKRCTYYNVSCAFDIETTSIEPPKDEKDNYIYTPYAFMYHWQLCIRGMVVFGRRWEEFNYFIDKLSKTLHTNDYKKLVIYVHNLAYEFQFMKDFLDIQSIFAKDKRKPMKVICNNGIEFRCSYFLSNMSLAKFCENSKGVIHYKLTDTYDYKKLRTPETILTEIEKGYCYNDVRGLCECIDSKLNEDTIATIPLTNTGYVRREYRQVMQTSQNRKLFEKIALSPEHYKMLRKAFRGGNTHANRFYSNTILHDVHSFDLQSSYPSWLCMEDFPMGKFMDCEITSQEKLNYYLEKYCCVMEIEIFDLSTKKDVVIPYIDIAHCEEFSNIVNDNGRVLSADYVKITLTNIDLDIIRETYNFKGFNVIKFIYAEKGKLPKELREKLMEFYDGKTQLKGVEGKEYEYMKSKNHVNATYGMMVTDICHNNIEYDTVTMEWSNHKGEIEEEIEKFYKSRNNFLSYQWGVFCTALARRKLQDMLNVIGRDVVYIDTDSIKFLNEKHIEEFLSLNEGIIYKAENNDVRAYSDRTNKDGTIERFHLGIWDYEGKYDRFKTLGAKKYCYDKNGKFEITVSGMSKKKGAKAVGSIENFVIGKEFNDVGRTTSWYNDIKPYTITIDGCTFLTSSNIAVLESTYTLGVTNEYWELISNNVYEI